MPRIHLPAANHATAVGYERFAVRSKPQRINLAAMPQRQRAEPGHGIVRQRVVEAIALRFASRGGVGVGPRAQRGPRGQAPLLARKDHPPAGPRSPRHTAPFETWLPPAAIRSRGRSWAEHLAPPRLSRRPSRLRWWARPGPRPTSRPIGSRRGPTGARAAVRG